eukprot:8814741-Karenia_brevis.AAC.1
MVMMRACHKEFLNKKRSLTEFGVTIGSSYDVYALTLAGQQCMMRNNVNGLCALCYDAAPIMNRLVVIGLGAEDLGRHASSMVMNAALEVASKLTVADVGKDPTFCPNKKTLLSLRTAAQTHLD